LVGGKEDVVFLSDTKLNTEANPHALNDIEKKLFNLNYLIFHNSKGSSRGVAIIIKKDIFKSVLNSIQDANNNFLLLKVELVHGVVLLGTVYGPNNNDAQFFADLEAGIRNSACESVILAGDWNATWDPRPVNENIDVINMVAIPSQQRSLCIN
jgi:exonuclease III